MRRLYSIALRNHESQVPTMGPIQQRRFTHIESSKEIIEREVNETALANDQEFAGQQQQLKQETSPEDPVAFLNRVQ